MGYLNCAASGAGISGGKLQKTGTLTLTLSTSIDYVRATRYLYAIDWNGNALSPIVEPNAAGGNWANTTNPEGDDPRITPSQSNSVNIDIAAFRNAYAGHANLGGLRYAPFIWSSSAGLIGEETFDFYFIPYTACGAPTACAVNDTLSTGNVTLSWSGATAGTSNAITGYEVQRCESSNGSTWGSWAALTTTTATSLSVAPPTTAGNYYKYRVRTLGAAGSAYYSGWKESTNTLRREWTACGAPTACAVNDTLSTGNVTLSWSGAAAGFGNAITGYEVQRCESSNGSTWGSWAALTTTAATSLSVAPPTTAGNYYKYRVRTQGAAGSAYYSGWKESTNTLRRDHAALAGFTDPTLTAGVSPVKALHMTELHDRVNTLRAFYGLSAYAFSPIDARGIAGWTDHVNEIKEAIEGVCTASGKTHEAWISFSVNCPRADVISQLRAVVLAL